MAEKTVSQAVTEAAVAGTVPQLFIPPLVRPAVEVAVRDPRARCVALTVIFVNHDAKLIVEVLAEEPHVINGSAARERLTTVSTAAPPSYSDWERWCGRGEAIRVVS